jgi:hypothetical protein
MILGIDSGKSGAPALYDAANGGRQLAFDVSVSNTALS